MTTEYSFRGIAQSDEHPALQGGFDLSLQYVDTDLGETAECADGCEERVIFSISKSF